jgi:hypothetical protein
VEKAETRRLGASGYFRKPANYDEFLKIGEIVQKMLAEGLEP